MEKLVDYQKVKTAKDAYRTVKANLSDEYLSQFKIEYKLSYDAKNLTITAKGSGFTMLVVFESSCCQVECELSLLYRPFKKKILSALRAQLNQVI